MLEALRERLRLLRTAMDRPWVRVAAAAWFFICTYDTVGSQLLPKAVRDRVPSVYEVIDMTSGFLPFWAWALIGMGIVVAAAVEYAAKKEGAKPWWGVRNQSPFEVSLSQTYGDAASNGDGSPWHTPITVRNTSLETIDGVEVHLLNASQRMPKRTGTTTVNQRLVERTSRQSAFSLHPRMPRDVLFLRGADAAVQQFRLGPLEDGRYLSCNPAGIYKIDIAVYGRGVPPAFESLAVGLDESGGMMYGAWRDDLSWPFAMRIETAVTAAPLPQSASVQCDDAAPANQRSSEIVMQDGKAGLARALDKFVETGVRERNRLNSPVEGFRYEAERQRLVEWSDDVVERLDAEFVTAGERSRFKTLDNYEAEPMGSGDISPQQMHVQTMWTEKIKRLRGIIDQLG